MLLYYLESGTLRAVKFDLTSQSSEYGGSADPDAFLCLTRDWSDRLRISACRSTTGVSYADRIDVESKAMFPDQLQPSEVDELQALHDGRNRDLLEILRPYISQPVDDLLGVQRIGGGDFVVACSSLQLTSFDGVGSVGMSSTRVRPQFRAAFPPVNDDYIQTTRLEAVHLKVSFWEGYRCDQAVTLRSDLVLILSENKIIALNYFSRTFAVTTLPIAPRGFVLFRSIGL